MRLFSPLLIAVLTTTVAADPVRGRCSAALPMPVARTAAPTIPIPLVRPQLEAVRIPNVCAVATPLPAGRTLVPGRSVVVSSPNPPLEIAEP
jgi:hypothetical protein